MKKNELLLKIVEYLFLCRHYACLMRMKSGSNNLFSLWGHGAERHQKRCGELTYSIKYEFHGIGCRFEDLDWGVELDVDFFERDNILIVPWKVMEFANLDRENKFSEVEVKNILQELSIRNYICMNKQKNIYYYIP